MIFDLKSGKRRRVVQVVFGFLAFIFFISFVGFGIGSDVSGGIFDAIGLGGGDSASTPEYEQQIEDANETLETDPDNERALLDLSGAYYRSATETGVTVNPQTGVIEISEESRADLEQSIAAWERYIETKPKRPDTTAAAQAAESYRYLLDPDGAAGAQAIVAKAQGTSSGIRPARVVPLRRRPDQQGGRGRRAGGRGGGSVPARRDPEEHGRPRRAGAKAEGAACPAARAGPAGRRRGGLAADSGPVREPRRRRKHRRSAARAGTLIEPPGAPGPIATMPLPGR